MKTLKLKEVAEIINGYAFKSQQYVEDGIRVIRIANVQDGYISDEKPCFYPENSFDQISKYLLQSQDLLISLTGNVGRVGILTDDYLPAALNQRVGCIRIKSNAVLTKRFLYYYLLRKQFIRDCIKASKGVAQLNLSTKWLEEYAVPVPPLPEQERIVARIEELFSQLDAGVETLKKTKAQLLRYRRSTIKNELEQSRNDSQWIDTTINQICDCLDSKRKPINKKVREQTKGIYPYYGANGITGRIDDYLFDEELVLVCEDETFIGRVKPFSYIISGKSWVNNHAHILRGKERVVQNKYLNYLLAYYPFVSLVTGTTGRKKLTKSALMNAPVRIIDFESQSRVVEAIESRLSVCDSIEQTVDTALQKAEAMRQSILKKAFEGEVLR